MKYKLTKETMIHNGITLHRIECVEAFDGVKIGDKGGWIEKESNLSQRGNAWVYNNAVVYGNAEVCDNAVVYGNAEVCDNAVVYGNAEVCDNAVVCGNAVVYGNAVVCDNAVVYGNAVVCDNAVVYGNAKVCDNAEVKSENDYMVIKNSWSSGRYFTWTRSNNMWKVGCFYGTGEELINKAYKDSKLKGDCYKAVVDCVENICKLINNE